MPRPRLTLARRNRLLPSISSLPLLHPPPRHSSTSTHSNCHLDVQFYPLPTSHFPFHDSSSFTSTTRQSLLISSSSPTLSTFESSHPLSKSSPGSIHLKLSPSPIASSSRVTLDDFLKTEHADDPFITPALNYAHEEELVSALIGASRSSSPTTQSSIPHSQSQCHSPDHEHDHWIDPATAYIGLRSSSLFNHYLYLLLPHITNIFHLLRPSGLHHVLVSDLLLHNPDLRALRDCLEANAAIPKQAPTNRVRNGKNANPRVAVNGIGSRAWNLDRVQDRQDENAASVLGINMLSPRDIAGQDYDVLNDELNRLRNAAPNGDHDREDHIAASLLGIKVLPRGLTSKYYDAFKAKVDQTNDRSGDRLRPSLVVRVYHIVQPHLRRRTIPRLSRAANLSIARSIIDSHRSNTSSFPSIQPNFEPTSSSTQTCSALRELYWEIVATTNFTPEGLWKLFEIIIHLSTSHGPSGEEEALRAIQYLIRLGKIPSSALGKGSSRDHPRAKTLLVLSVILKASMGWGLNRRGMKVVDVLLDLIENSVGLPGKGSETATNSTKSSLTLSEPAIDLLLQTCRIFIALDDPAYSDWTSQTLVRLSHLCLSPRPTCSTRSTSTLVSRNLRQNTETTINLHIASLSPHRAVRVFDLIPADHKFTLSPNNMLRIAESIAERIKDENELNTWMDQDGKKTTEGQWWVLRRIGDSLVGRVRVKVTPQKLESEILEKKLETNISKIQPLAMSFPQTHRPAIIHALAKVGKFDHVVKLYNIWFATPKIGNRTGSTLNDSHSTLRPDDLVVIVRALTKAPKPRFTEWKEDGPEKKEKKSINTRSENLTTLSSSSSSSSYESPESKRAFARRLISDFETNFKGLILERVITLIRARLAMRDTYGVMSTINDYVSIEDDQEEHHQKKMDELEDGENVKEGRLARLVGALKKLSETDNDVYIVRKAERLARDVSSMAIKVRWKALKEKKNKKLKVIWDDEKTT